MKNRILHLTRNTIPYVKELHTIAGGVLGCLVMQQLDYWFEGHPEGFYKFLLPSDHHEYKEGHSWTEELGMSKDEFRTAFDKIGIRYKSKTEFDKAVDKFQGKFYCSYVDRRSKLTFYFRNHELVDAALDELLSQTGPRTQSSAPSSSENPRNSVDFTVKRKYRFTGNQESCFTGNKVSRPTVNRDIPSPSYRDYNTETTTTTVHSNAIDWLSCTEDLIFPKCSENESIAIRQLMYNCPTEMRQIALDEVEGARQAGVIKTNLVPFARGIMTAISRGTFSVGHGSTVADQRVKQINQRNRINAADLPEDQDAMKKGMEFINKLAKQ